MGMMDLFNQGDVREKLYAAAAKNNVPQGGITGKMFSAMFPHGLGNLAFGRNPEPMPPLETPEGTALMADLASNMMVPGTFIGPKGLARLFGDDAAKGMLATAESKLASGVPKEAVFQELGVFKGPEGKWRYEIDDSNIPQKLQLTEDKLFEYPRVSESLPHNELFNAYPDAADIRLAPYLGNDGTMGTYLRDQNAIELKPIARGDMTPQASRSATSTLLHELQHAVQGREGFARGGSPGQFSSASEMVNSISGDMKIAPDVVEFWRRVDSGTPRKQAGEGLDRDAVINALGFSDSLEARNWASGLEKQMNEWADIAIDPFSAYQRLAGEAEARAVQDRMNMPMSERRSIFPDYAKRDDLIIRGLMSH